MLIRLSESTRGGVLDAEVGDCEVADLERSDESKALVEKAGHGLPASATFFLKASRRVNCKPNRLDRHTYQRTHVC